MNPWGWLFIALAVIAIYIGIKGTENSVYAFITGQQVKGGSSASSGSSSASSGIAGTVNNAITNNPITQANQAGLAAHKAIVNAVQGVRTTITQQAPPQLNNSIPATIQNWLIGAGKALGL